MGENMQHFQHIILYNVSRRAKMQPTCKNRFWKYGEGAVTDRTGPKKSAKFGARDFSLDDSDQIKTLRTINIIPRGR